MYISCVCTVVDLLFFFFKQKTAYEMRISDWSSDVCSSDLLEFGGLARGPDLLGRNEVNAIVIIAAEPRLTACDPNRGPGIRMPTLGVLRPGIQQIGRASCRERVCQYV